MKRFLIFLVAALVGSGAAWAGCILEQTPGADMNVNIPVFQDSNGSNAGDLATGLTIAAGEVYLSKNGGTYAAKNDAGACTEDAAIPGHYRCPIDSATDLNTAGWLAIVIEDGAGTSSEVPVFCQVLPTQVYDSLYGTDNLQVDVVEHDSDGGQSVDNINVVFSDTDFATAYNTTTNAWETNFTDVIGVLDGAEIGVGAFAANAITDAAVANDVQVDVVTIETVDATNQLDTAANTVTVTSIGAGVIDSTAVGTLTGGDIGVGAFAANSITNAAVANDVQVDVVTIETVDATDQLDTAANTVTVTSIGAGVIDSTAVGTLTGGDIGVGAFAANSITDAAVANDVQVDVLTIETVDATDQLDSAAGGLTPIATGTAQNAGTTATTLQLASAETFADNELIGAVAHIKGGSTGVGQTKCILDYTGSTDTATVTTWTTTPTGTITYEIVPSVGDLCPDATADVVTDVWAETTRTLTAIDEDDTTLDLDATTIGTVTTASTCTALGANAVDNTSTNLTENLNCDMVAISTSATAANNLELSTLTMQPGTVSHDVTPATTDVFYSDDVTEATADHYIGRIVIFTSGAVQYQASNITDYALVSGEGQFTVTALTEAPADNVTFIIL